ncbi:MAG: UDP-N-acetylmuramate dehydrogenase [Oscillospiraceae bacterium]|nr:UDP-N-acetylmuramate dehydrogenase [Oscillospiraceae bacterium]
MNNWIKTVLSLCEKHGIPYEENAPMSAHTTFKIGGPARILLLPENMEQIAVLAAEKDIPLTFIGRGSNLLVADGGINGAVVVLGSGFSAVELQGDTLICEAGASLTKVCQTALQNSLSGVEFAYGIPGTVGGAVYMNAGAYGGEVKDVILWAEYIDKNGELHRACKDELELSYRHSRFCGGDDCIVRAAFELIPGDPAEIKAKMDDLMGRRRDKQPLEYPSAGSTFKRPEGAFAAALIDQCGLKGMRVGDAMVSEKHAGFLVNVGKATCAEMDELIGKVRDIVAEKTGYHLETEVYRLGE